MASRLPALGIDAKSQHVKEAGNILSNAGALIRCWNWNVADSAGRSGSSNGTNRWSMPNPFAGKTFSIVESPANMKSNAKPVFNESTSDAAAMMYGSPLDRQMSMPKAGNLQ